MEPQSGGPQGAGWWDKVDNKFLDWGDNLWRDAGFRAVPNCIVRKSAYIAPGVVLMPSFVNIGAYVDSGTMVDTWANGWKLRADRQERPPVGRCRHRRRAGTHASRSDDNRG